jgi:hypothetical protein
MPTERDRAGRPPLRDGSLTRCRRRRPEQPLPMELVLTLWASCLLACLAQRPAQAPAGTAYVTGGLLSNVYRCSMRGMSGSAAGCRRPPAQGAKGAPLPTCLVVAGRHARRRQFNSSLNKRKVTRRHSRKGTQPGAQQGGRPVLRKSVWVRSIVKNQATCTIGCEYQRCGGVAQAGMLRKVQNARVGVEP